MVCYEKNIGSFLAMLMVASSNANDNWYDLHIFAPRLMITLLNKKSLDSKWDDKLAWFWPDVPANWSRLLYIHGKRITSPVSGDAFSRSRFGLSMSYLSIRCWFVSWQSSEKRNHCVSYSLSGLCSFHPDRWCFKCLDFSRQKYMIRADKLHSFARMYVMHICLKTWSVIPNKCSFCWKR